MKKIFYSFITILLLYSTNVLADTCKGSNLTNLTKTANNIKIDYEIVEKKKTITVKADNDVSKDKPANNNEQVSDTIEREITNESIKITIYNITNDIYLIQTNDKNDEKKSISYSDTTNGQYSFETDDIYEYTNYKYEVYSNVNSCDTTLIKTINYTKPKYNENYDFAICQDNSDVPGCEKYITKDTGINDYELTDYVNKYLGISEDDSIETDNKKASKKYIKYIISGGLIILIGGGIAYIFINKKRSKI